jgi:predicted transcriptional regulator
MSATQKTTVYLDAAEYRRLKLLAAEDGRPPAALIREAVSQYAARRQPRRKARSVGLGRSGRKDLSERAEELLAGFGRTR